MPKKSGTISSKATTAASILGTFIVKKPVVLTTCVVCSDKLPAARLDALKSMEATPNRWTCVSCSTVTKVKGLYLGESGTSQLQLCDKVYNDSVRHVFRRAEVDSEGSDEPNEEKDN